MKILEPASSALLITGCVYSAGISQNNAFMRAFGVNPEFSQPPLDKILFDGGLVTFEIFYKHLEYFLIFIATCAVIWSITLAITTLYSSLSFTEQLEIFGKKTKSLIEIIPTGIILLTYITYLCFATYASSQKIGERLSEDFIDRCHGILIKEDQGEVKACAFRKDKDSIWYYTFSGGEIKVGSRLLTELQQVTYLDPTDNPKPN